MKLKSYYRNNFDKKIKILLFLTILVLFFYLNFDNRDRNTTYSRQYLENKNIIDLKTSGYWNLTGSPILIDNSDFNYNWSKTVSDNPWCSGNGTVSNPYIIENVTIDGQYSSSCIEIRNSNEYFIIRNCTMYNSGFNFMDPYAGIRLDNVNNGILINNTCSFNIDNGIYLVGSDNNDILENVIVNNYYGLYLSSSDGNNITDNIFNNNYFYGIYLDWSLNNIFSNNNLTGCGFGMDGQVSFISTYDIDTTNLINGKPIYYFPNEIGLKPINFSNAGQVILVNCQNSSISNLNIFNSSCGIALHYCENITIASINASFNSDCGIYLKYSNNNTIKESTVNNNGFILSGNFRGGIVFSLSNFNTIKNNSVHFNSQGIYLQNCQENIIINNSANFNTRGGIHLWSPNNNLTENKMINCGIEILGDPSQIIDTSNTINGKPVYYYKNKVGLTPLNFSDASQVILVGCNDSLISNVSTSYGTCGISLYNCFNISISNNSALFNTLHGIYVDWASNNVNVSRNNISNNQEHGIYVIGDNSVISRNTVNNNRGNIYTSYGIEVFGDSNNITNNDAMINNTNGVFIRGNNNKFINNTISNSSENGILLNGDSNLIINNSVTFSKSYGMRIYYSDYNNITGNLFQNNTIYGVYISDDACLNNSIYENKFFANGINAYDDSLLNYNQWDSGYIGNYWDDYNGTDINDNGIGDAPYIKIGGIAGAQDGHPIWWDPPVNSIHSPSINDLFNNTPPEFNISIDEGIASSSWYTLDDGVINTFFIGLTGTINQTIWDNVQNGTVKLMFYVNDSLGYLGSSAVSIRKDNIAPIITIHSPKENIQYRITAPSFNISIYEGNLDTMWYVLFNGTHLSKNYIFTSLIGNISQNAWNAYNGGMITITFYANDTLGNIRFQEVTIEKYLAYWKSNPITINDDGSGNYTWAEATNQEWCSGSGTWNDPFIIKDLKIDGQNTFSCIEIRDSNVHFIIRNCIFYNGSTGIKLSNTTNGQLLINNCSNNNGNGIYLYQSQSITISRNIANNNNNTGIRLWFSDYNTIKENSVNNNSIAGISLTNSTNNNIINNTETINYNGFYGIYLIYSDSNNITKNVINYNEMYGIYLLESDYNYITENTLIGNKEKDIYQENCEGNIVKDNLIEKGKVGFPLELIILLSIIGGIAIVVPAGAIVYKKKVSLPKKKKEVKPKLEKGEIIKKEKLKIEKREDKEKLRLEKQKKKSENKLRKKLKLVDSLMQENRIVEALKNLSEIEKLAKLSDLIDFVNEAEQKIIDCKKMELDTINQIKQTVLNLGRRYPRLELMDISEKCGIKNEALIEMVIREMIKNKEIHGDYFSASKSLVLEAITPVSAPEVEKEFKVFLSYSTLDTDYFEISRIVGRLELYPEISNVYFWEADSGEDIVTYMEQTLKETNVFVFFCSENSIKSKAVEDEWHAAFQLRKEGKMKIIPVYEEDDHIPYLLKPMLNVKFIKDNFDGLIQKLYEEILR